jgi:hypothetical protein
MDNTARDKPELMEVERLGDASSHGGHLHLGLEEVRRKDAMATAGGVTLASFAHLNEKKILRKVCVRDIGSH